MGQSELDLRRNRKGIRWLRLYHRNVQAKPDALNVSRPEYNGTSAFTVGVAYNGSIAIGTPSMLCCQNAGQRKRRHRQARARRERSLAAPKA
jgi:hypothetical protein